MFYPGNFRVRKSRQIRHSTENRRVPVDSLLLRDTKLLLADQRPPLLISFVDFSKRSITSSKTRGYTPRVQPCRFRTHTIDPTSSCKFWSVLSFSSSLLLSLSLSLSLYLFLFIYLSIYLFLFLSLLFSFTQLFPTSQSLTKWKQYWLVNLTKRTSYRNDIAVSNENDSCYIPL